MADVSIPSMILFIASIVVAASVAGVLVDTVGSVSSALDDRGADLATDMRTDVEIINDPESGVYDGTENVTLYVKNTGIRTLPPDPVIVDVIVDGQYRTDVHLTVVDGNEWRPHRVARVNVTVNSLTPGDHRVKFVVDGEEETFEFRNEA